MPLSGLASIRLITVEMLFPYRPRIALIAFEASESKDIQCDKLKLEPICELARSRPFVFFFHTSKIPVNEMMSRNIIANKPTRRCHFLYHLVFFAVAVVESFNIS